MFIWDGAQIVDVKTLSYNTFANIFKSGALYLFTKNGNELIEIRYVDDTHLKINCTSAYAKLTIVGNEHI